MSFFTLRIDRHNVHCLDPAFLIYPLSSKGTSSFHPLSLTLINVSKSFHKDPHTLPTKSQSQPLHSGTSYRKFLL